MAFIESTLSILVAVALMQKNAAKMEINSFFIVLLFFGYTFIYIGCRNLVKDCIALNIFYLAGRK